MVQAVGSVNVVVKLNKAFYNTAGTRIIGDGATVADVTPLEASNLAKAGMLVAGSDVLIDEADFATYIKSLESLARG
jgi:hypothetical protein